MTCFHTAFTVHPVLKLTLTPTPTITYPHPHPYPHPRFSNADVYFLTVMAEAHQVVSQIAKKENKLAWSCQMRLMPISFFVNSERTVLLSVKYDLDPTLPPYL